MVRSSRPLRSRSLLLAAGLAALLLAPTVPALLAAAPAAAAPQAAESSTVPVPQPRPAYIRNVAKQTRAAHAQPVRLLFVGDSILASWMRAGPEPWHNLRAVWNRFYGDRQAFDMGMAGDRTQNVLWRLAQGEVAGLDPRLVVLMIGTNNIGFHDDAAEVEAGIDRVVQDLHARLPRAHILVLGILPREPLRAMGEISRVNRWLSARYAAPGFASFLDIGGVFLKDGRPDPALYVEGVDPRAPRRLLHPNAAGAERMARAMEPEISRWLGDPSKL